MLETQKWYIVKQEDGTCEISDRPPLDAGSPEKQVWGPFSDRQDAIARRVGLIRSGKCQPTRAS